MIRNWYCSLQSIIQIVGMYARASDVNQWLLTAAPWNSPTIGGITFPCLRDFPGCQSARLLTEPPEDFSISHEPFTLPDTLAPLDDLSRPVSATSERPLNEEPEDARSSTYLDVPERPMELPLDDFPVTEPAVIDSTLMLEPLEVE